MNIEFRQEIQSKLESTKGRTVQTVEIPNEYTVRLTFTDSTSVEITANSWMDDPFIVAE